jgi:hypothetical protein
VALVGGCCGDGVLAVLVFFFFFFFFLKKGVFRCGGLFGFFEGGDTGMDRILNRRRDTRFSLCGCVVDGTFCD